MSKTKKPVREIPFSQIEAAFTIFALGDSPAVGRASAGDGYYIRVLISGGRTPTSVTDRFDYFFTDPDGTVRTAPRGYAKDYRPGRITGLAEAVEKYAGGAR